ncbi:hypothetical protein LAZ67_9001480 [Cordylochernes scorpioides]|uniref:Gag protein n=1 Tax=Cordylochernes scorpioides TaxID=51811 RepID=A0ABY6KVS8_9ARAC|nr:hypothetical protein LAZ67_9001480 [Cordylochernes scorpioides]
MFPHVTQRSVTSAARIQPPETFDFSTPNEWPKWRKRFERYLVVSGMKKKEEADKIDLFMYLMGDHADDIFRTFKFEKKEEATKIDSVLKAFDSHFCVRKNIIYERAKFNSRIQEDREPVDEFITSLYKLADSCEFEGLHEQLIRDRIVVGVRDKALSERMQLDSELTLEKAVKMVRQQEAVRQQQVDLQRPSTSQKVNQVKFNSKKQSPKQQQQPSRKKEKSAKTRSRCPKCGGFTHREGQACRAEGQKCNLCSKTGHFANCCPDKQAKTAEVKAVSELDEEIGFLLEVSSVEDSSNLDNDEDECRRRWTAEIQVNGKKVKFKLDSQADVTCVPLCLFRKIMGQQRLVKSDINLRAAEFSELQTVGSIYEKELQCNIQPTHRRRPFRGRNCECHSSCDVWAADKELDKFLDSEIRAEKEILKSEPLPKLEGYAISKEEATLCLTKNLNDEVIRIKVDLNNSVDDLATEDYNEQQESLMRSRPDMKVELDKNGTILAFTLSMSDPQESMEPGEKGPTEPIEILDVSHYNKEMKDSTYLVSGDIMDQGLYELLINMLSERGIDADFINRLSDYCTSYEHMLYIKMLENIRHYIKK